MLAVGIFCHFSSSDCLMVFSEDRLKCGRLVVQLTFKHSVRLWKVGPCGRQNMSNRGSCLFYFTWEAFLNNGFPVYVQLALARLEVSPGHVIDVLGLGWVSRNSSDPVSEIIIRFDWWQCIGQCSAMSSTVAPWNSFRAQEGPCV